MSVMVENQKLRQLNEQDSFIAPIGLHSERNENDENDSGFANHFQVPNLSSMLYQFTNSEADRVQSCFRVGNFHSLRDLPKHLLPGNVSFMSSAKINENLYSSREERSYIELQKGGGYFSKFEWQPDPYSLFMDAQTTARSSHLQKQIDMHGKVPFKIMPQQPARYKH